MRLAALAKPETGGRVNGTVVAVITEPEEQQQRISNANVFVV